MMYDVMSCDDKGGVSHDRNIQRSCDNKAKVEMGTKM